MPINAMPVPADAVQPFPVDGLVDNSVTDFDLFINLEDHFILYSGNGYRWTRQELNHLLQTGFEHLYIRQDEVYKAQMYHSISQLPDLEKEQGPAERIQSIEQVGAKFIKCLYDGEITDACVEKAETIADSLVNCLSEDRSAIKYLSGLADHDYYTYYHSVRVSCYAVSIAISLGMTDEQHLRDIALGGIFHDIGKKEVPMDVLNKKGPLTDGEWKTMKDHPRRGYNLVADPITAFVPREIVLRHHEKRNGAGYPFGLDKGSLVYEVQIATLADIFDALTSSRSYQNKRSRFEALDFIKNRLLGEEICPEAFKALIYGLAE